ncbi:MAG TPA: hypothetical protein VF115_05345, partial [Acidimicrobiia bacterium]
MVIARYDRVEGVGNPMSGKIQVRLAVLAALAALVAVLVPATLASGSHTPESDPPPTSGVESVVLLTMGKQDNVTWSGQTQSISTSKNDCTAVQFASTPELLKLTPIGGALGEVKDGFGIQSPTDGSGEPCGRAEADDSEEISVSLGSALHQYLMTAIDVDLELKFNAKVTIIFKHNGVEVARVENWSGMGGSDDGPDSKDGDNFRFNSEDNNVQNIVGEYFDEVVFKPTAGAISLEGGADGTKNGLLAANGSSQFRIKRAFDGEIDCENPVDIGSAASDTTYGT